MTQQSPILIELPEQLVGDRTVVRPFTDADAEPLNAAVQESIEHVRPWLPWYDQHQTVGDTLAFIRRSRAQLTLRESFTFGIFSREGDVVLGGCSLHVRDWRIPAFEIGYWVRKSAERQGYVTEATWMITSMAFEILGAQRVMIRCEVANTRSRAVPERLGFRYEGEMRNAHVSTDGNPADVLVFGMVPDEYERARGSRL